MVIMMFHVYLDAMFIWKQEEVIFPCVWVRDSKFTVASCQKVNNSIRGKNETGTSQLMEDAFTLIYSN